MSGASDGTSFSDTSGGASASGTPARSSQPRIMLVVLDGLADRQYDELGGLTPLEAAETPNLDALAAAGSNGFMYPLSPGLCPSSFQAHFALFGYPLDRFPGRGLLEAHGEGIELAPGEVVMRVNMLLAEDRAGGYLVTARPDPREGFDAFAGLDLDMRVGDVDVRFVPTGTLQGFAIFSAKESLSHEVTDADPFGAGLPVIAVQPFAEATDRVGAARTAAAANEWMREIVRKAMSVEQLLAVPDHTGTRASADASGQPMVVTKWAGAQVKLQPFSARFGLRGATVATGPLYGGVGVTLGMDQRDIDDVGRPPTQDLRARIERGMELLGGEYDFVHVHTKVPDSAGHRKNPAHKRDRIAQLDEALNELVRTMPEWRDHMVLAVTADHATPAGGPLYHSGEAVPLAVIGGVAGRDEVTRFGERFSRRGDLGQLRGVDLMPVLLNATDRSRFLAERFTADERFGVVAPQDLKALREF